MTRAWAVALITLLAGCADQSKGSALNECRMKYYLDAADMQQQSIPDCMKSKSFETLSTCDPQPSEADWDWRVPTFPYNDPRCYQPIGAAAWAATLLSPM